MIENEASQAIQQAHMEAAALVAEAVMKATALGYTLEANGSTVDVVSWAGVPLLASQAFGGPAKYPLRASSDTIYEAECLTSIIDWLDGVAYGRSNVGIGGLPDA